mmetsp:Transcript_9057/g.25786  ORF Transcript_9057/g.25786 Transcript_9057/m.25786 type:complete len:252 (+) Transcript_9057:88-843(+)
MLSLLPSVRRQPWALSFRRTSAAHSAFSMLENESTSQVSSSSPRAWSAGMYSARSGSGISASLSRHFIADTRARFATPRVVFSSLMYSDCAAIFSSMNWHLAWSRDLSAAAWVSASAALSATALVMWSSEDGPSLQSFRATLFSLLICSLVEQPFTSSPSSPGLPMFADARGRRTTRGRRRGDATVPSEVPSEVLAPPDAALRLLTLHVVVGFTIIMTTTSRRGFQACRVSRAFRGTAEDTSSRVKESEGE